MKRIIATSEKNRRAEPPHPPSVPVYIAIADKCNTPPRLNSEEEYLKELFRDNGEEVRVLRIGNKFKKFLKDSGYETIETGFGDVHIRKSSEFDRFEKGMDGFISGDVEGRAYTREDFERHVADEDVRHHLGDEFISRMRDRLFGGSK